jgi:hypothetical protein
MPRSAAPCLACVEQRKWHSIVAERLGTLIVDERTRLPCLHDTFRKAWLRGVRPASTDDLAKTAGHTDKRTAAKVYDRAALEAAGRVARARAGSRQKDKPGT